MIQTLLLFPLLFAGVFWLPGRLAVAVLGRPDDDDAPFALSVGLGIVLVDVPAVLGVGLAGLAGPVHLERWMLLASSALVSAALALHLARRRNLGEPLLPRAGLTPARLALGLLTVAATAFFLLRYDADALSEESCMVRASMAVNVDYMRPDRLTLEYDGPGTYSTYRSSPMQGQDPSRNAFLTFNQGQRLGPALLLAPFVTLFGPLGFRLVYALQGLLLPGLGFMLGRRLGTRPWMAWAVAAGLAVNPYTVASPTFDENFLALGFGALSLALLLRRRTAPMAAGAAFALFLSIRHVGVLLLPFVALFLARGEQGLKANLRFLAGLALLGLPEVLLHGFLVFQHGQAFEGAISRRAAPHSLFGIPFSLPVLLNWPFVEQPLRSPYVAWPTLVAFPLDLLRRFGLLLALTVPAGLVALRRTDRRAAWLLVGWFAPILALVMVQSNWSEPVKMGVPASVLPPVIVVLVLGAGALLDPATPWRRRAALAGLGFALPLGTWGAAQAWHAPLDERVVQFQPDYLREVIPDLVLSLTERPEYLEADRARNAPTLAPDLQLASLHPTVARLRGRQLVDELGRPSMADYERPLLDVLPRLVIGFDKSVNPLSVAKALALSPEPRHLEPLRLSGADVDGGLPRGTRRLTLDLTSPPSLSAAPLRETGATGTPALPVDQVSVRTGLRLPYSEPPQNLVVARDRLGTTWVLLAAAPVSPAPWPSWVQGSRVDAGALADLHLSIELPVGQVVRLIELRSIGPYRAYERTLVVGEHDVWSSPSQPASLR